MSTTRFASLAAAVLLGTSTVHAQALATFGSAELAGFGEGSALLGASLSTGHQGWGPIGSLIGQTYRYRDGVTATSHAQAFAISPSVGLQYSMPTGAVQGSLGYTFVNTDFPDGTVLSGSENGGTNSAFVSGQMNHWGNGENSVQLIGSYAFESQYFWTRARVAHRVVQSPNPIYLGLEGVLQGTQKTRPIIGTSFMTMTQTRYQGGPTIEYRVSNDFRVGASAGVRAGDRNYPTSGYARVEFLMLSRM